MRWTVHGERDLYDSPWVTLSMVDVEIPGGRRYEHHAIKGPDAAGVVVADADRGVLLLWRHRFLSDSWAWELPAGMVDDGETPEEAARRECVEESGWEPGALRLWQRFNPIAGMSTQSFWVFRADTATQVGPFETDEAERIEWVPFDRVESLLDSGQVLDGMSVVGLLRLVAEQR